MASPRWCFEPLRPRRGAGFGTPQQICVNRTGPSCEFYAVPDVGGDTLDVLGTRDMAASSRLTERVAYARRESGQHNTTTRARSLTFEELYRRDFHSLVALAYGLSGSRI